MIYQNIVDIQISPSPNAYAVSNLSDLKDILKLDASDTSMDNELNRLLNEAVASIEHDCLIHLSPKYVTLYLSKLSQEISLPFTPIGLEHIVYHDIHNTPHSLTPDYALIGGSLHFLDESSFSLPVIGERVYAPWEIKYESGYEALSDIPEPLTEGILRLAAMSFQYKGPSCEADALLHSLVARFRDRGWAW